MKIVCTLQHLVFSHPELAEYTLAPEKFDFGWQFMFLVAYFAITIVNCNERSCAQNVGHVSCDNR